MSSKERQIRRRYSPLYTWLVGALVTTTCFLWFRSFFSTASNDIFIANFFLLSAFLITAFFGVGYFVLTRVFKTAPETMALPTGVGVVSIFLTPYLRISLDPFVPLSLLTLGSLYSVKCAFQSRETIIAACNRHTTALFVTLFSISLITLSFPTLWDAFLLFPTDFDSNLIHVTAPRIIVEHGYFFYPNWLRGLWLPQLTMNLYTFILSFSNQTLLKTINVVCFVQIALLFARTSTSTVGKALALPCFVLLTTLPEFRQYIVQTNLDTIFALFSVSAFFLLLQHLRTPTAEHLILLSFICGLSAGQKHFGLMFSAPTMTLASLAYMWDGGNRRLALRRVPIVAAAGITLISTFSCFYLHNLVAGNALLFPFIGSQVNTYGWDQTDLSQMIDAVIPYWGHSKNLAGYFLLPLHIIRYPEKYQFNIFFTWADLGMSVSIGLLYILSLASLIHKPLRRPEVVIPSLTLCAHIFLWYRGSQVIRYLFPVLICFSLLTAFLLNRLTQRLPKKGLLQGCIASFACAVAIALSTIWIIPPKTPLAQSDDEILGWLSTFRGSKLEGFRWLSKNTPPGVAILNLAGHGEMAQFPGLLLCGDWFGRCRYSNFLGGHIQFRPWPDLKDVIRANKIQYIIVNWNLFPPDSRRPVTDAEWGVAIPESSKQCLEHMYYDQSSTDIYKVKDECVR